MYRDFHWVTDLSPEHLNIESGAIESELRKELKPFVEWLLTLFVVYWTCMCPAELRCDLLGKLILIFEVTKCST